mgnify:CR=1 FL=1
MILKVDHLRKESNLLVRAGFGECQSAGLACLPEGVRVPPWGGLRPLDAIFCWAVFGRCRGFDLL